MYIIRLRGQTFALCNPGVFSKGVNRNCLIAEGTGSAQWSEVTRVGGLTARTLFNSLDSSLGERWLGFGHVPGLSNSKRNFWHWPLHRQKTEPEGACKTTLISCWSCLHMISPVAIHKCTYYVRITLFLYHIYKYYIDEHLLSSNYCLLPTTWHTP